MLVASDIAARGLNLGVVDHVVVYDLHGADLMLVHRVGRTGRMGNEGHAVLFFDPFEVTNVGMAATLVRVSPGEDVKSEADLTVPGHGLEGMAAKIGPKCLEKGRLSGPE